MATAKRHPQPTNAPGEEQRAGERVLAAATSAQPLIRSEAAAGEDARTLPPAVVGALRDAGVFGMTSPRERGGPELTPMDQFKVVEAVSIADGSAGWCAQVNSTAGFITAFLDTDVVRSMFPSIDTPLAGSILPGGKAVEVDGGYRVDGRWTFATGVHYAGWVMCTCRVVTPEGQPVKTPNGAPAIVQALVPAEHVQALDTWRALGMRGTGSHDFTVHDVFVPREHTLNLFASPLRTDTPLYRLRTMFLFTQAAVPLGVARAAVDNFIELTRTKVVFDGPLHEQEYARQAVGQAHAIIASARAYCLATLEDVWSSLERNVPLTLEQRANFRLALTHAMRSGAAAVSEVFRAAGSTAAVMEGTVLERAFRDVNTVGQHLASNPSSIGVTGGMLIGDAPTDPRY